jgi:hypothetical protein
MQREQVQSQRAAKHGSGVFNNRNDRQRSESRIMKNIPISEMTPERLRAELQSSINLNGILQTQLQKAKDLIHSWCNRCGALVVGDINHGCDKCGNHDLNHFEVDAELVEQQTQLQIAKKCNSCMSRQLTEPLSCNPIGDECDQDWRDNKQIKELEAELAEHEWVSVEDLPDVGRLVYSVHEKKPLRKRLFIYSGLESDKRSLQKFHTHWMYAPALPNQEAVKKLRPGTNLLECKWQFPEDGTVYCRTPLDRPGLYYGKPCSKRCENPEPEVK